jgi:hypothetical protein
LRPTYVPWRDIRSTIYRHTNARVNNRQHLHRQRFPGPVTHVDASFVVVDDGRVLPGDRGVAQHVVAALLVAAEQVHALRGHHVRGAVAAVAESLESRVRVGFRRQAGPVLTGKKSFLVVGCVEHQLGARRTSQAGGSRPCSCTGRRRARGCPWRSPRLACRLRGT